MARGSRPGEGQGSSPPKAGSHEEKAARAASEGGGPRRAAPLPVGASDSSTPTAPGRPRRDERGPPTHGPSSSRQSRRTPHTRRGQNRAGGRRRRPRTRTAAKTPLGPSQRKDPTRAEGFEP